MSASLPAATVAAPASPACDAEVARFRHLPFLDGVRTVAIAMVMAWHASGPHTIFYARRFQVWLGVDAFFVLSGFLITSLLVQEHEDNGAFSIGRFYARRFLRISPAYVVFLGSMALYYGRPALRALALCAVYLSNYDHGYRWGFFASYPGTLHAIMPLWSLCVEEQFYLLWPLTLAFFLRSRGGGSDRLARALKLTLIAVAVVLAWKTALLVHDPGIDGDKLYYPFDTRADSILIGCAAALASRHPALRRRIEVGLASPWMPAILIVALALSVQTVRVTEERWLLDRLLTWVIALPAFAALVAALILTLVVQPSSRVARALSNRVVVWVGRLSYSIYLWHSFAVVETQKRLGDAIAHALSSVSPVIPELCTAALGLAVGVALACLSYYGVEKPFLRLKHRFEARVPAARSTPDAAVAKAPA